MKWKTGISINRRASKSSKGLRPSTHHNAQRESPRPDQGSWRWGARGGLIFVPRGAADTVVRDIEVRTRYDKDQGRWKALLSSTHCWGRESFPSLASVPPLVQVMILSQDRHLVARELECPRALCPGDIPSSCYLPFFFLHVYVFVSLQEDESKILMLILNLRAAFPLVLVCLELFLSFIVGTWHWNSRLFSQEHRFRSGSLTYPSVAAESNLCKLTTSSPFSNEAKNCLN